MSDDVQAARAEGAARLARVERLARDLLTIHSEIVMDTPEDRALHAEVVATFKAALDIEARAAALRADDAGGEGL